MGEVTLNTVTFATSTGSTFGFELVLDVLGTTFVDWSTPVGSSVRGESRTALSPTPIKTWTPFVIELLQNGTTTTFDINGTKVIRAYPTNSASEVAMGITQISSANGVVFVDDVVLEALP